MVSLACAVLFMSLLLLYLYLGGMDYMRALYLVPLMALITALWFITSQIMHYARGL